MERLSNLEVLKCQCIGTIGGVVFGTSSSVYYLYVPISERPLSEVPLYMYNVLSVHIHIHVHHSTTYM